MSETPKYTNEELTALEQELKKNPSASINYVKLADAQLALNKKQQAFSTYRAAKVICPDDPVIWNIGAKVYEALEKRDEAIDCLEKSIKAVGVANSNSESVSHLAELLYNTGKKEQALSWLRKLVAASDNNPEVLMKLAQVHLSLGNHLEAQNYLKQYREKAGVTREMFVMMGQTMFARGFYDGAVKNYTDAIENFPKDPDMHLGLGKAWLGMNEKDIALKEFTEALSLRPGDVNILLELGKLQAELGLTDEADDSFEKIEKSKLNNGEVLLDIAKHFLARKNDIRGLKYLEAARALSGSHPEILKLLGEIYLRMGRYEDALVLYTGAAAENPSAGWAHEGAVTASDHLGRYSVKAEAQKNLLSLRQGTAEDWCDYAETLIKLGKFDASRVAFENASKLDSTCLRAFQAPEIILQEKSRAEGEKLAKQGEEALAKHFYMTATDKLEKALALCPENPFWSKLLAEVSYKIGDYAKASQLLSVVRANEPNNYEVGYKLAKTYEFLGDYPMAIELLTAITKVHPTKLDAHLMLLRLKRCQIRGNRVTADMLDSIIRNIGVDLADIRRDSPVYLLVKGYAYYIFSYRSSFQVEGLNKAEACFREISTTFGDVPDALYALALCERVRGNFEKAVEYLQYYVRINSDLEKTVELARLYENFSRYTEARKCYADLRKQFPEKGFYRRKYVEMTAMLQAETGKNELTMLLSEAHKDIIANPASVWPVYESAIGQEMASREQTSLSAEWLKRSMLSWHKAEAHPELNYMVVADMVRCQLRNLSGTDKTRTATSLKKLCEKNMRETPDAASVYASMARCFLAFNDLTNKDKALNYLERAWFIDDSAVDVGEKLAETAKALGKSVIVDVVGYNVILSEPEIANGIFKFQ